MEVRILAEVVQEKRPLEVCLLSEYIETEGEVELTTREGRFAVPLLLQFRAEHRRWKRAGHKATDRNKLDKISSELGEEIPDPNRRALFINLVLSWDKR